MLNKGRSRDCHRTCMQGLRKVGVNPSLPKDTQCHLPAASQGHHAHRLPGEAVASGILEIPTQRLEMFAFQRRPDSNV